MNNPLAIIRHISADPDPASDLSRSMEQSPSENNPGNPSIPQQVIHVNMLSAHVSLRHLDSAVVLLQKMGYIHGITR